MDVEIVLFDGFDELDAVGPYEVLDNGRREGADVDVSLVTAGSRARGAADAVEPVTAESETRSTVEPPETVTAGHGMEVLSQGTLGEPDLLVVPGGGWSDDAGGVRREVEEGRLPAAVAERHAAGATVASVCTGAMVLAAAGLLDDRPATTHHVAHADLEGTAERVVARVVDDGDVLTAGGVTAGIDLALWLLEREFGADVADAVARRLEYDRSRDVHAS